MINQSLITFLKGIKQNNDKQWYDTHKDEYTKLRAEFTWLITELGLAVAKFDPAVAKAQKLGKPTTKVFRIHRDARFAKDKTKYKLNISGLVAADVKSDSEPSYYFSIQPGGHSFLGGGLFMPERMVLSDIRDKIEMYPKALAKIDHSKEMRTEFPDGLSRAHTLKTAPRGHDVEHEAIEYLRLKSLTVGKNISDSELKNPAFTKNVIQSFKSVYQLNKFLRP
jgi:uncharacterized protein (TIGR02453 family)